MHAVHDGMAHARVVCSSKTGDVEFHSTIRMEDSRRLTGTFGWRE